MSVMDVYFNSSDGGGNVFIKKNSAPTTYDDYDYFANGFDQTENFPSSFTASKIYFWTDSDPYRSLIEIDGNRIYRGTDEMCESETPWQYAIEINLSGDTDLYIEADIDDDES